MPATLSADIGRELHQSLQASLAALRRHIADDDPKVSLRAAAELTKLLTTCGRFEFAEPTPPDPPPPPPPTAPAATAEKPKPKLAPLPRLDPDDDLSVNAFVLSPAVPMGGPRLTSFLGQSRKPPPVADSV